MYTGTGRETNTCSNTNAQLRERGKGVQNDIPQSNSCGSAKKIASLAVFV